MSNGINERLDKEFSRRRDAFRKEHLHALDSELQDLKNQNDDLEGFFANEILTERGRELRRSARIIAWATVMTAGATVAAALAAWIAIYFQYCQTHNAPNESHQAPVSVAPALSPSPSP